MRNLNTSQINHDQHPQMHNYHDQIHHGFQHQSSTNDEFFEQILSNLPSSSWPADLTLQNSNSNGNWNLDPAIRDRGSSPNSCSNEFSPFNNFDQSSLLTAKLQQHQITGGNLSAMMMIQQQMLMSKGGASTNGIGRSPSLMPSDGSDSGLVPLPLLHNDGDRVERFQNEDVEGSVQGLINGFNGSLHESGQTLNQSQHFQGGKLKLQNSGGQGSTVNGAPANGSPIGISAPVQPRPKIRARRGQATDPHSIAERLRRERIAERMKSLQELVPNANRTDKASMLDEIIEYVKFLQLQVKVLSMSRLGGASSSLVTDMSSKGGDVATNANGGGIRRGSNGAQTASAIDTMSVTENQVAKLMEEDMGSAMQYLQGKGLCLMPISLANAISTTTGHRSLLPSAAINLSNGGEGPSSPSSLSVLSVQSAIIGNNCSGDNSVLMP